MMWRWTCARGLICTWKLADLQARPSARAYAADMVQAKRVSCILAVLEALLPCAYFEYDRIRGARRNPGNRSSFEKVRLAEGVSPLHCYKPPLFAFVSNLCMKARDHVSGVIP